MRAAIRLPALFSEGMVFQRDQPVPIWGWAASGEQITVSLNGRTATATADDDGRWKTTLPPLKAGGPFTLQLTSSAGRTVRIGNVLVGEVWFCGGQSNMVWWVYRSKNAEHEIATANCPQIRHFAVRWEGADRPKDDCTGHWSVCSPKTAGDFSAVAYFFGRVLHKELGVPIGLVNASRGGTAARAWVSRAALISDPYYAKLVQSSEKRCAGFDFAAEEARYQEKAALWDRAVAKARAEGTLPPHRPRRDNPCMGNSRPSMFYNAMVAPLAPMAVRGVIWYQGESDIDRAWRYRNIFPLLIRDWRKAHGRDDLPFGFVQIAPFRPGSRRAKLDPTCGAELRESQLLTLKKVPHTGMVVTMDIGDPTNIHPANKQEVGRRLALWALATVYGRDLVYSGPIYESLAIEGERIRLRFSHAGSGLATNDGKPASHFIIAGADRKFHPAGAEIDGDTLVVRATAVPKPVAVRYAWRHDAEPNLINREGLPASPFRTDRWKLVTEPNAVAR